MTATYAVTGLTKIYGGVTAIAGVDLEVHPGEVHALLGANGAGKSTLVKVLVGAESPDEGSMSLDGAPVAFRSSAEAAAAGVSIVSQELNLFGDLDVLENLFLLREPRRAGVLTDRRSMARLARPVLEDVGLDVALDRPVAGLRLAEQQLLEIARSLLADPRVLFLDEPTSALGPADTARLLALVRRLRDRGVAVVYVSHFLEDVFAVCDTVTVLRNGRVRVHRWPAASMTVPDAVAAMLGEADAGPVGRAPGGPGGPGRLGAPGEDGSLTLEGVAVAGALAPLDLAVRRGEVVGLAGLEGSGAGAVMDVVFARRRHDAGTVTLPDGRRAPRTTAGAVRAGVALVPADRKGRGVMLDGSVQENVTLVAGGSLGRMGLLLRESATAAVAQRWAGRARHRRREPADPGGPPVRRQPAEGRLRQVARGRPHRGAARRPHPRRRRPRQGRDARDRPRSRRPRPRGAGDLQRAGGADRAVPPGDRLLPGPRRRGAGR